MSWQQIKEPNLDPYINQDGHTLTDWYGWCLAYVQTAFGAGWAGSNAWDCWNNHTVNRHADWELPSGVYVPIFFRGYHDLGHAAIYKDGHVWSTPISHKPTADQWNSIQEVEQHYGVTYVGWAEGLGGTQVANFQPDPPLYTITAIEPKQMQVAANHYKWNLAQPTFADITNNPITTSSSGLTFTAVATLIRPDLPNYTWYLEDANTPHGWNSLDCTDYVAPAPLPAPAAPYVPPAAPIKGTLAEKYQLLTTVMWFASASDALFHKDAKGTLSEGTYYVITKNDKNYNLSTDNMKDLNQWVNTDDNVAPKPVVEVKPPPSTAIITDLPSLFTPFPDGKSRRYVAQQDMYLFDLAAKDAQGINIRKGDSVPIFGTVTRNNMIFLIPRLSSDTVEGQTAPKEHYYGIPTTSVYTGLPAMKSLQYIDALSQAEEENRQYRKSLHHETTEDRVYYAEQLIARFVKDGGRVLNGIIPISKIRAIYSQKDKK